MNNTWAEKPVRQQQLFGKIRFIFCRKIGLCFGNDLLFWCKILWHRVMVKDKQEPMWIPTSEHNDFGYIMEDEGKRLKKTSKLKWEE